MEQRLKLESGPAGSNAQETGAMSHGLDYNAMRAGQPAPAADSRAPRECLRIEDLCLFYGDKQALYNVNMSIPEKRVTAFIGPSGCGKSTLLRCFNRLNELIERVRITGAVRLMDENIFDPTVNISNLRRRVGMVFQKPNPFPKSIYENVAYGLRIQGLKNRRTLDRTVEGEVLLLDEPASALDPLSTLKIEELIYELKQNYTIVIVTHNMQQAARVSDYTAFMYMGNLIEFGETKQLFTTPKHKQTEDYITGRYG